MERHWEQSSGGGKENTQQVIRKVTRHRQKANHDKVIKNVNFGKISPLRVCIRKEADCHSLKINV